MSDPVGAECLEAVRLAQWGRALGLEIQHSEGCPGIVVPGVGLLIDEAIEAPERHRRIEALLRRAGRSSTP